MVQSAEPSEKKLNILFIAVDDLRTDLGCYGHPIVKTPNIDRLAERGMLFDKAYCQQAVCSPSRTSLLTGLRPDSTKVYDLETHFRDTVPEVLTLPQHFKNNGYETIGFGKIYHGHLDDPKSWSRPFGYIKAGHYHDPETIQQINKRKAHATQLNLKGKEARQHAKGPSTECFDAPENSYRDGEVADRSIAALRELKDKPFFLAVGFVKPHLPFTCPKKYWDMYDRDKIKPADNPFMPQKAPEYAGTTWGELRAYSDIPKQGPVSDEKAVELIHGYYACTSFVDAQIGRVIDELDSLGLADKTAVVLWGDHGWKLGEHGLWTKHTNFELDTHVPMIFSAPSIKAVGQKTSALTEFVDIYPTLCDLAGLDLPDHLEGTSMTPLFLDPEQPWKTAVFSQYPRWNAHGYAMRTKRYRYVEWRDLETHQIKARELYDHKADPDENKNVAGDAEYAEDVEKLYKQMRSGWKGEIPANKM
jgi:arylsulfatase A-like enzyme